MPIPKKGITYLGHLITVDGVIPDPRKIDAVKNFPIPKTRKNIKQFLGLTGYYRRFIRDFAKTAKPLNQLLKKEVPFKWTSEQQNAFESLRDRIRSQPILQYPDFKKPFLVTTDASNYAIGAVLSQGIIGKDLPIAYGSRALNSAEINYFTTEKELLACVWAVQHFRPYLYGRDFTLVTDHRPLVWLHSLKDPVSRLARWKIKLNEYNYTIIYKPGRINCNADALSRNPCEVATENGPGGDAPPLTRAGSVVMSGNHAPCGEMFRVGVTCARDYENERDLESLIATVFTSCGTPETVKLTETSNALEDSSTGGTRCESETSDGSARLPQAQHPHVSEERVIAEGGGQGPGIGQFIITTNDALAAGENLDSLSRKEKINDGGGTPFGSVSDNGISLLLEKLHSDSFPVTPSKIVAGQGSQKRLVEKIPRDLTQASSGQGVKISAVETVGVSGGGGECPYLADERMGSASQDGNGPNLKSTGSKNSSIFLMGDSCIIYSKDKISMGKSHIVNFVSADGDFSSPVNQELIKDKILDAKLLKEQKLPLGHLVVLANNGRHIFNLVVKSRANENPFLNILSGSLHRLKEAMIILKIQSAKICRVGNNLDQINWTSVEQIIRQHFTGSGLKLCVCSAEIIIPPNLDRENLIKENHESTIAGHKGVSKTYWRIRENYYWKSLKNDVREFVRLCRKCQENKLVRVKTRQPMKITDTPTQPFEKVQIDIVGPLPETPSGNKYILTIQDNFSKYSDAIPLLTIDSVSVAYALAEEFISRYGCPRAIHTDQGSNFISNIMKTFCKIFKIEKITSTAFHPQSLGSLERSHHSLVEYLKTFSDKKSWDQWLRYAVFSYNTSIHESTGYAPYTLVFGREARVPTSLSSEEVPRTYVQYVSELFRKIADIQANAVENLIAAKMRSKRYYDQKLNPKNFKEGDFVYLLKEPSISKLDPQYKGPYIIERLLGDSNAEIIVSDTKRKIVHLDKLKLAALPATIDENDGSKN